jgi:hypothetical protein
MKVLGAVFLCIVVAASLASQTPDAGQSLRVPSTRMAYVDSLWLAQHGVKLDKNPAALADLSTFGKTLNVDIVDVEKLQGKIFIADNSLDLTEDFLDAWKAKPSRSTPLSVPALKIPDTAVAFIDTESFADPQKGINKLVNAFRTLEVEFKPRKDEIAKLREQLQAGTGDRKQLEGEIKRKQAAGQKALDERVKEVTGPVYSDIAQSLTPFCKRYGISLLFDISKMKKTDKLPPFDLPFPAGMPDMTEAFITAYNRGALLDNILIR